MSNRHSDPPRAAVWLLRHFYPGDREALTGDLLERFQEGQTVAWFWRQVLIAFAAGIRTGIRKVWPFFVYAVGGLATPALFGRHVRGWRFGLDWRTMHWPWSQLIMELGDTALLALIALSFLAVALAIQREFRWVSLFRTAILNLALIAIGHFLPDALPRLRNPLPLVPITLFFCSFLAAAALGCRPPRHVITREAPPL